MSDGGEGCVDAMLSAIGGERVSAKVHDPLMRPITAEFGILEHGNCAVIEMAAASGLTLLSPAEQSPIRTTTFGTGELVCAALDRGVSKIIIGIGGSATTDGGVGAAQALGCRFVNAEGETLPDGISGGDLEHIVDFDISGCDERIAKTQIHVASDVHNPFTGADGAARIYSAQKGATPEDVERLEKGLTHIAALVQRKLGIDLNTIPGAGAAGGLGGGLVAFLGAKISPGIDIILDAVHFSEKVKGADLVITGEGSLDAQTINGKTIYGIIREAKKSGVPVVALAGQLKSGYEALYAEGLTAAFPIMPRPATLEEALRDVGENLTRTTANLLRLFLYPRQ